MVWSNKKSNIISRTNPDMTPDVALSSVALNLINWTVCKTKKKKGLTGASCKLFIGQNGLSCIERVVLSNKWIQYNKIPRAWNTHVIFIFLGAYVPFGFKFDKQTSRQVSIPNCIQITNMQPKLVNSSK